MNLEATLDRPATQPGAAVHSLFPRAKAAPAPLRDLALPVVFNLLVTDRSMAWIYDHHLDRDAPVTG